MTYPIIFVQNLRSELLSAGEDFDTAGRVLDVIADSEWLADLTDRLHQAEQAPARIRRLHSRQDKPTRHWQCCEDHIPSPANRERAGGWVKLDKERSACDRCTYTEHYHCTYDSHDSCGHDDYPCLTVRVAEGEDVDDETGGEQ